MLLWFTRFVRLNEIDHVVLPRLRTSIAFVADFIQNIIKIVHCVYDFGDISLLQRGHFRYR